MSQDNMTSPQLKLPILRYFLKLSRITSIFKNSVIILKIKVVEIRDQNVNKHCTEMRSTELFLSDF